MPTCALEGSGSETGVKYSAVDVMLAVDILYIVRDVKVTKGEVTEDVGLVQIYNRNMRL